MLQSAFVKAVSPSLDRMEDGKDVRLARTAVVIQAGAEPVARVPVQLEAGEGNQPVGRALVHRQPPRPSTANRELEEKVQEEEEAPRQEEIEVVDSSSVDESLACREQDPQVFLENRVKMLLRRVRGNAAEELQDALDSEERKRQEIDSEVLAEREEQKRRRQRGEPTRALKRSLHFDNVLPFTLTMCQQLRLRCQCHLRALRALDDLHCQP